MTRAKASTTLLKRNLTFLPPLKNTPLRLIARCIRAARRLRAYVIDVKQMPQKSVVFEMTNGDGDGKDDESYT